MAPARLRASRSSAALPLVALSARRIGRAVLPRADRPHRRPGGTARCGAPTRDSKQSWKNSKLKTTDPARCRDLALARRLRHRRLRLPAGPPLGHRAKGQEQRRFAHRRPKERKVRIEVGYGLEGTLTDAVSRLIIDHAILPRFRAGDFAGGSSAASTTSSRFCRAMPRTSSVGRPSAMPGRAAAKASVCSRSWCSSSSSGCSPTCSAGNSSRLPVADGRAGGRS